MSDSPFSRDGLARLSEGFCPKGCGRLVHPCPETRAQQGHCHGCGQCWFILGDDTVATEDHPRMGAQFHGVTVVSGVGSTMIVGEKNQRVSLVRRIPDR